MKKLIAVILVLASIMLCACGNSATKTDAKGYADKDQYLEDMAKGIKKRLSDDADSDTMNEEERASYYCKLVQYELDYIEKYETLSFEEETFDRLAHMYIDACQAQLFGAQNYRNKDLYDSLWSGGYSIRAAVITELYTRYNLPISSEEASSYASSSSGNVSVTASMNGTLDIGSGLTLFDDNMVTYEKTIKITKDDGSVLFNDQGIKISIKSLELKNDGDHYVNFLIENSLETKRVTCFLSKGYIDDYQIGLYCPWGYYFVDAGKKGDTFSNISGQDLKDAGLESFKTLTCYLYVLTSEGDTGEYIAKIPLEISRSAFH